MHYFHQPSRPAVSIAAAIGLLAMSVAVPMTAAAREVSIPFNPANFSDPTKIDNPYFPLVAGQTYVYRAVTTRGCEENHFEVTHSTRLVAGVRTRVVHDIAYEDPGCNGNLVRVEDTFDWHAQDNAGNVWYFGEDTQDCNGANCTPGPGSWEAGVNNARPGLYMLVSPRKGDRYFQEFAAGVAEDEAQVQGIQVGVTLAAPIRFARQQSFAGCLKTKDFTALAPGSTEHKFYCPPQGAFPGGLVAVDELHGGTVRFELISVSGR